MTPGSTLGLVVDHLERAGIAHMVAGSFASSRYGLGRSTYDIDLVIDPAPGSIDTFTAGLDQDRFHVDLEAARRAHRDRDQFSVVDLLTTWKVDLIVRKDRPFSASEFRRRLSATIAGVPVFVATAEDTVLAKLEWGAAGGSERQRRDVVDLIRLQGDALDTAYLDEWAPVLGVAADLADARRAAAGSRDD